MKINSVTSPSFNSWSRCVYKKSQNRALVQHRNTTCLYRERNQWTDMMNFFADKYKNSKHVNVYDYACSNGAEAYTFVMHLFSNFSENVAMKFMPVLAKDYDKKAIKEAKKGILSVSADETARVNLFTKNKFEYFFPQNLGIDYKTKDFFYKDDEFLNYEYKYALNSDYTKYIKYEVADIRKDYKNINPHNSIIFAKNFWPYLGISETIETLNKISNHIDNTCCLVMGAFDFDDASMVCFQNNLNNFGFRKVDDLRVFEKR